MPLNDCREIFCIFRRAGGKVFFNAKNEKIKAQIIGSSYMGNFEILGTVIKDISLRKINNEELKIIGIDEKNFESKFPELKSALWDKSNESLS
jgi:hypothetical protein